MNRGVGIAVLSRGNKGTAPTGLGCANDDLFSTQMPLLRICDVGNTYIFYKEDAPMGLG